MNKDIFLVHWKRSVLFWLNFSLAKMWKDRLEDEEDSKNISLFQAKQTQVDVTGLEEKNDRRSGPLYYK